MAGHMEAQKQPGLETLDLTEEQMRAAKRQIQLIAYRKWERAGRPPNAALKFWLSAEQEWIANQYVPNRYPVSRIRR